MEFGLCYSTCLISYCIYIPTSDFTVQLSLAKWSWQKIVPHQAVLLYRKIILILIEGHFIVDKITAKMLACSQNQSYKLVKITRKIIFLLSFVISICRYGAPTPETTFCNDTINISFEKNNLNIHYIDTVSLQYVFLCVFLNQYFG